MPALQIRDVPEDVYQDLVALAKKEHRSINQQALFMLREKLYPQLYLHRQDVMQSYSDNQVSETQYKARIGELRRKYSSRPQRSWPKDVPTPTEMIREDRDSR